MAELELGPLRFGIVGAGRLGRVLARALQEQGFLLTSVSSASEAGRSAAVRALDVPAFDDPAMVLAESDVLLMCVPDQAIAQVATRLAEAVPGATSLRVVHTSGCIPLAALEPLRAAGCDVLSLHPLQTVTDATAPADLRGSAAAVTAHDVAGETFGAALAHALGLHPFALPDEARPLYHAAASMAANFTVTLQAAVQELTHLAQVHQGVATHAFARLTRSAIERVEREGAPAALTGPIVRGDEQTVREHLDALDRLAPGVAAIYRPLARATVQLAVDAGRLEVDDAARIDQLVAATPAQADR